MQKTPEQLEKFHLEKQLAKEAEERFLAMAPEFKAWPKIGRMNRDIVITEKIDGTNAAVVIRRAEGGMFEVFAQSRTRMLTPQKDNMGFRAWVDANADVLISTLGEGTHFGEWWGKGIQRGYGLDHKRFSLFNTSRWASPDGETALADARKLGVAIYSVPVLWHGPWIMPVGSVAGYIDESDKFNEDGTVKFLDKPAPPGRRYMPEFELEFLKNEGSVAAPGQPAEGIVIFHIATGSLFKATVDNDAAHKFEVVGANVGR